MLNFHLRDLKIKDKKKNPRCYSEIFECLKPQSAPSWVICCPPLIATPCKLPLTKLFSTGKAACTFQMGCPILLTHKNLQLFPTIARMMWLAGLLMSFLRPACPTPVSSLVHFNILRDEQVTYGWTGHLRMNEASCVASASGPLLLPYPEACSPMPSTNSLVFTTSCLDGTCS